MMTFHLKAAVAVVFGLTWFFVPHSNSQESRDRGKSALRAAILSGEGVGGEADLLAAELPSRMDQLALLERSDLAAMTAEGSLIAGNLPAGLESADVLILVELIEIHELAYLATRLVGREDGRVHSSDLRLRDLVDEAWAEELAKLLRNFVSDQSINKSGKTVSVRVIREEYSAGKIEDGLVSVALTRLVNSELSNGKQVRLLERLDLGLVQFERFLTRIDSDSFEEADRTVSGTFRLEDGKTRFELRVETPATGVLEKIEGSVPTENLAEIAAAMADKLLQLLDLAKESPADSRGSRVLPGALAFEESKLFEIEAERALRLGLHESAAKFAETALLLDPQDGFGSLYFLACGDLFGAFPALRGRGINVENGLSAGRRNSGVSDRLSFIDVLTFDSARPEQWSALATAVERISELRRRADAMEEGRKSDALTKFAYFADFVARVTQEATLNSFAVYGSDPPPIEREQLGRIAAASGPSFFSIPEVLILKSSAEQAIDQMHEWLYGAGFRSLQEGVDRDYERKWRGVSDARHRVFAYFAHVGYDDRVDKTSRVVDKRILKKPFVAFLSENPTTFETVFSRTLASAEAEQGILTRVDAQFQRTGAARSATERAREFKQLREIIRDHIQELKALGMLEIYTVIQADWEQSRYPVSVDKDPLSYWKAIHAALYAGDGWVSGSLTDSLARTSAGQESLAKKVSDPRRLLDFLAALREDVTSNGNEFCFSTRHVAILELDGSLKELGWGKSGKTKTHVTPDDVTNPTDEIPDPDTIELSEVSYGFKLQTLASHVTDENIFIFQLGREGSSGQSRILKFNLVGQIDQLPLPDEVHELIYEALDPETLSAVGRAAGLKVDKDSIDIVFPGGMATYHRAAGDWEVTPIPFLRNRQLTTFAGDQIVSYTGVVGNLAAPPVQGIYLTDPKTMTHTALVDTSRHPPLSYLDEAKQLKFTGTPFAFAGNHLVFGMKGANPEEAVYQFTLDTELDTPGKRPLPVPFLPGRNGKIHASRANGFVLFVATRPPKHFTDIFIENGGRMHVGAFAIDDRGKYYWLLNSGSFPSVGSIPDDAETERRMFLPHPENDPLFQFPATFSSPPGRFSQVPESISGMLGPGAMRPVLHFNGSRLLLLSDEFTADGRRLLYVWKNREVKAPTRFAIKFAGFGQVEGLNKEDAAEWNRSAGNTVTSIFEWRERLVFEYQRGFFSIPLADFEKQIGE